MPKVNPLTRAPSLFELQRPPSPPGERVFVGQIESPERRDWLFQMILAEEGDLNELKYIIYRLKPDAEKTKKELLLDIVEDEYEKDPEVRQLWKKSVAIRRSRSGDKITIEFTGPLDLLGKLNTLAKPLKTTRERFRTIVGRKAKIP